MSTGWIILLHVYWVLIVTLSSCFRNSRVWMKSITAIGSWNLESSFPMIWNRFWREIDSESTGLCALGKGHSWGSKEVTRWQPLALFEEEPLYNPLWKFESGFLVMWWLGVFLGLIASWSTSPRLVNLNQGFCPKGGIWQSLGTLFIALTWKNSNGF